MEINLGGEEIVELQPAFTPEQVQEKALSKRIEAFGQMARLIQRPKPEDIEITTVQKRVEPFWYACAIAHYAYKRRHTYRVDVLPEVQSVTLYDNEHPVLDSKTRSFAVEGVESCVEEIRQELMLDAQKGNEIRYDKYLAFPKNIVADLVELGRDGTLVVPPEVRGSFVVRKLASLLMKTFQADQVLEERIDVQQVALYYRPVFAIEYFWRARDKKQVLELDGLLGDIRPESGELRKKVVSVLENDALFDIGADAIGTVLPGVNVAVKLGRFAARKVIK